MSAALTGGNEQEQRPRELFAPPLALGELCVTWVRVGKSRDAQSAADVSLGTCLQGPDPGNDWIRGNDPADVESLFDDAWCEVIAGRQRPADFLPLGAVPMETGAQDRGRHQCPPSPLRRLGLFRRARGVRWDQAGETAQGGEPSSVPGHWRRIASTPVRRTAQRPR